MRPDLKISIFCLDDHTHTLENIDEYFKLRKIENYFLFSSEESFFWNLNEDVHIAVIDYWLGGVRTGLDVCKKLIATNPQCFIIIISSQTDNKVIIDFKNSDADRYVSKTEADWLVQLGNFVEEGIKKVNNDLDWYYNLIKRTREQALSNEKSVPNATK